MFPLVSGRFVHVWSYGVERTLPTWASGLTAARADSPTLEGRVARVAVGGVEITSIEAPPTR
ncbi:unnamed protein product [Ectocarpus sp. 4 AP-2014]